MNHVEHWVIGCEVSPLPSPLHRLGISWIDPTKNLCKHQGLPQAFRIFQVFFGARGPLL